ncbi:MAG: hypothetical protein KC550_07280, partial [Nanoarchaeota archaeon]|nr:hypothetical protein [Nanoarchaeota archaeon]
DNKFYSIQVDTKNSIFENSINSYLKEKLGEEYFIDKINSDILIVIKDYKSNLSENLNLLDFNIFDINKIIEVGQIHSYANNSKKYIEISGVNIESKLSAIKEFIKNKDYFMYTNSLRVIYSNDTNVIGDIDYFYNNLKDITYESNNNELNWIINNILYDNKFKIREFKLPINFENKTYDYIMWRLIPENSLDYQNYVDKDNLPIVMAGGLWSDIKTWKELGTELANKGYEVYLLELSGGENIECENCYNYNYNDLVQTVYPTYINKVLELSGKDKIKYVGHSNGARTALDAISKNKVDSNIFETLVLVAVPGAFSELSFFAKIINKSGNIAIERLNKKGIFHPSIDILAHELESIAGELIYPFIQLSNDKNKISTKLFEQYYMWINSNLDEQPGINVSVDYLSLIYGDVIGLNQNDLIVPVSDEIIIFNNINSSKKRFIETDSLHLGMSNKNEIKSFVESTINKKLFE